MLFIILCINTAKPLITEIKGAEPISNKHIFGNEINTSLKSGKEKIILYISFRNAFFVYLNKWLVNIKKLNTQND